MSLFATSGNAKGTSQSKGAAAKLICPTSTSHVPFPFLVLGNLCILMYMDINFK